MGGANKPILAVLAFVLVFPILYFNFKTAKTGSTVANKSFLNIKCPKLTDIDALTKAIKAHTSYLEVKRVDKGNEGLFASYLCTLPDTSAIQGIVTAVEGLDNSATVSFVEQPDLLV